MLKRIEPFKDRADVFQVDVILDANVVLSDVIWMCRKRKNPEARSNLVELLDCKVVRAHAPTFLLKEIAIHLPRLAKQHRLDEEAMRVNWERIRILITFVDVGEPDPTAPNIDNVRDPKDLPYIRLQQLINAPIATQDKDLAEMGGQVIRIQVFGTLKSYSRKTAVEYRIKTLGVGSVFIGMMAVTGLFECSKLAVKSIRKIPKPILLLIAALIVIAVIHPTSRKRIKVALNGLLNGAKGIAGFGLETLLPIIDEHYAAQKSAQTDLEKAKGMLRGLETGE